VGRQPNHLCHAEIACAVLAYHRARLGVSGSGPTPCLKAEARSERQEDRGSLLAKADGALRGPVRGKPENDTLTADSSGRESIACVAWGLGARKKFPKHV
jgi:hypothetical protein